MALPPIRKIAIDLRESFWFLPSLFLAASILAGIWLTHPAWQAFWADWRISPYEGPRTGGARDMLATIATSMATIAGVTFSITMVVLSLASTQYSSRVLKNFVRDRGNQMVLGVLAGIFVYCLVVLNALDGEDQSALVPVIAVELSLVLAIIGVGFFIYFIHHTAASVLATHVLRSITLETREVLRTSWAAAAPSAHDHEELVWSPVVSPACGYVITIDHDKLIAAAEHHVTIIRMHVAPGDYLVEGLVVADCALGTTPENLAGSIVSALSLAGARTIEQDPAYGLRQILDIAFKALSPGINDVHTAVEAVDHLTSVLAEAARCGEPPHFHPPRGKTRLITCERGFADLADYAFRSLRHAGSGHQILLESLLRSIRDLTAIIPDPSKRQLLAGHCSEIAIAAASGDLAERDIRPLINSAEALAKEPRESR